MGSTRTAPRLRVTVSLSAVVGLLCACVDAGAGARDPFTATGELVALSGGDAGAESACITCHGLRGEGDRRATPALAGLPMGYMHKQLEDYADGLRQSSVMRPIAKALHHRDRGSVAAYYAAMPPPPAQRAARPPPAAGLYHRGDPDRGLPPCAACHGPAAQGLGPAYPPLAGQPAPYVARQLQLWREGRRRNDPLNQMARISQLLTPSEVAGLAQYVAGLSPAGAAVGQAPAASR